MKKSAVCLVAAVCFFLPNYSSAQAKLKRRTFLDGKVDILVPVDFTPLPDDSVTKRLPDPKQRPAVMLTGDNDHVAIFIEPLSQQMSADSMGMVSYKIVSWANLKSTYPDVQKLDEGVERIHGKYVAFLKVANKRSIIYYFFTVLDGKVILFTIICSGEAGPKWKDVMEKIRDSLRCG